MLADDYRVLCDALTHTLISLPHQLLSICLSGLLSGSYLCSVVQNFSNNFGLRHNILPNLRHLGYVLRLWSLRVQEWNKDTHLKHVHELLVECLTDHVREIHPLVVKDLGLVLRN